ncbi:competence protein ComEC [Paenibacillus tianmuensis]|uniref:Competence protein ComEC n=1 Tax=Paenibacillus tianmuensis TaxID=624147 RepID=A0A1G4PT72_9BACL|nr:DNA internalization-related competence protein ComEC/Rec2 [Paenibacillus tianmuensis]SCW35462.1 competence protein ComEC [Paenibacillus tianmuensis]
MSQRPIVAFAVYWGIGYAITVIVRLPWMNLWLAVAAGMLYCAAMIIRPKGTVWLRSLLIVAAAAGIYGDHDARNRSLVELQTDEVSGVRFQGRIVTPVSVDGDRVSFQAEAESVAIPEHGVPRDGGKGERMQFSIRLLAREEQETVRGWERGHRIELDGTLRRPAEARNFGGFDYRNYLRLQHIHWQMTAKGTAGLTVTSPESGEWGGWLAMRGIDRFRDRLAGQIDQLFPPDQSGFMKGMLIGLTDEIEPKQFEQFSRLGLTHIIAISGLNVAIFLACLIWLLRRFGLTRETVLLTALALMPLYIAVTGASPSIVRAGIMAMIGLYAAYRNRLKDGLHIALIAGVGMLVWNPYYLLDVSFQLSFLVTLGLILGVPQMNKLLPVKRAKLRDALSITVVAQLISFPLSIYYFNQFSLLSFAANFALVPAFSVWVMPGGTAAMLLGFLWETGAGWLGWLIAKTNELLFYVVEQASKLDAFQTIWPSPSPVWILAYYGLLCAALVLLQPFAAKDESAAPEPMLYGVKTNKLPFLTRQTMNRYVLLPASLLGFAGLLWYGYDPERGTAEGRVQFLDVGQGDSILIQTLPGGHTILVDGGGTVSFRKPEDAWKERRNPYEVGRKLLVPLLKKRGVQQIDELILTHQDADHFGGLQAVLEHIPVRRFLFNGTLKPLPSVEKLFQTALEKGTELVEVEAGDTLQVDAGTALHFLYPLPEGEREGVRVERDQNPSSIVFLMEMAGTRWLFTGDIGRAEERKLLDRWSAVSRGLFQEEALAPAAREPASPPGAAAPVPVVYKPVDVLKVAHHGSKSSTADEWLNAWRPKHAVISAGVNNMYGHPNPQVLDRLTSYGISVQRTDRDGEVQMTVRGGKIYTRTKLRP